MRLEKKEEVQAASNFKKQAPMNEKPTTDVLHLDSRSESLAYYIVKTYREDLRENMVKNLIKLTRTLISALKWLILPNHPSSDLSTFLNIDSTTKLSLHCLEIHVLEIHIHKYIFNHQFKIPWYYISSLFFYTLRNSFLDSMILFQPSILSNTCLRVYR